MTATREDIVGWITEGQQQRATHLIVVCDTFNNKNYPVFVMPGQNAGAVARSHAYPSTDNDMVKINGVYNLSGDLEEQLGRGRCIQFD